MTKKWIGFVIGLSFFAAQALAGDSRILILNAAGLDSSTLGSLRAHAEKELFVPVAAETVAGAKSDDLKMIGQNLAGKKTAKEACLVILANGTATNGHALMMTNEQIVVVNVKALRSDDPVKGTRRLQRWVLRGPAILFGVGPDMDPRSVMCDYVTVEDLDMLGLNFSPPWMDMVRQAGATRGLKVRAIGE